jgi:hypothetical protein
VRSTRPSPERVERHGGTVATQVPGQTCEFGPLFAILAFCAAQANQTFPQDGCERAESAASPGDGCLTCQQGWCALRGCGSAAARN